MTVRVAAVPASRPFVETLARGLLAEYGADPAALARVRVLLPTRRAARALREALPRLRGGAMLLPDIRVLGDLDEEEDPGPDEEEDLGLDSPAPPAIGALERRLLLAELVRAARPGAPGAQAMALAAELARLLDGMQTARVDFAAFDGLVPDDLAEHWRETLEFLAIVIEAWPKILAERGLIDPAARRVRALEALAAEWRRAPPDSPVVAAGSTGSQPAVADLLAAVAGLPRGLVLLPGLDRGIDDASWEALDETHPQFGLKALLERLGVDRRRVPAWPEAEEEAPPRAALVREIVRPGATVEEWRDLGHVGAAAVDGLEAAACPDARTEAETVALAMRRALERPGRTAALVTADRGLARRVRAELGRWGLEVDDSAGRPLADTEPGVFLRLVVDALARDLAPVPLLALFKHPLSRGGGARADFLRRARQLERACLRGPRPAPGFAGLKAALEGGRTPPAEDLADWLDRLADDAAPLARALAEPSVALADLVDAHRAFAESLSTGEDDTPAVWTHEAGSACWKLFDDLARAAAELRRPIPGADYAAVLDDALRDPRVALRPDRDRHPRLFVWGRLEARLLRADLVVMGGLNEGSWPGEAAADPWLGRHMRARIGLELPERFVGLAAHDFAQLLHAPRVLLTRAATADGTPTVKARWLTRLDAVLQGAGLALEASPWPAWRAALDPADGPPRPVPPPAPRPPAAARPRELSVTRIEAWRRDPYEIYARHILDLRKLDPVDADPAQAEYGSAVHDALARFVAATPGPLPADARARLLAVGCEALAATAAAPSVRAFWRPRFARVADWFLEEERKRRAAGIESRVEIDGKWKFDAPGGPFILTARADRIDLRPGGGVDIVDYKTGAPPSEREILAGYAPQLPLEGAILMHGGFAGLPAAPPESLAHWRLSGGDPAGEIKAPRKTSAAELAEEAEKGLRALVALYDDEETPYPSRPAPRHAPRYSDYEHLARVGEWGAADGDES